MLTLPDDLTAEASQTTFSTGLDVDQFFQARTGQGFIDWFNSQCANRQNWSRSILGSSPDVKGRFLCFWNHIPEMFGVPTISLAQFSALMSILVIEVGGDLLPVSEQCGRPDNPGLAYAFNTIAGVKRTYNALPANRLAGDLFFSDQDYWAAHQAKAQATTVRQRPDLQTVWNADVYPQKLFSADLNPAVTGFIQEADFYKFRGRGFVQITWRVNYLRAIAWVQGFAGKQAAIAKYAAAWKGIDPDRVATMSSNQDWDDLFQNTDLVIPCVAIGLHNQASGNYLDLANDAATFSAPTDSPGTLYRMGLRISGSAQYATLFHDRVIQLLTTLCHSGDQPSQQPHTGSLTA
jgi:hypothetical protein